LAMERPSISSPEAKRPSHVAPKSRYLALT
jgi:hypothetical protein